jgi:hypothetical protein
MLLDQRNMRRSLSVRLAVLLAGIHLALSLGSFWISFSTGMKRFDAGAPIEMGRIEAAASFLSGVLLQPMLGLWSVMFSGHSGPVLLQWLAILLNSLLWGTALAFAIGRLKGHLRSPRSSV